MPEAPGYGEVRSLVEDALEKLRKQPKLVTINGAPDLLAVVGDLHGDLNSLERVLSDEDVRQALDTGLVVFLGDYVDRGPHQVEVVAKLLELYVGGARVLLLRGNHEPPSGLEPVPHDFPDALAALYGSVRGRELYTLFRSLFDELPYAAIIRGLALLVHGGPPTWVVNEAVASLEKALSPDGRSLAEILEQVLWNDPDDAVDVEAPSPRGAGVLWGWRVTEATLAKGGVRYIVRGHEPAEQGYKLNHGDRVLTLFTRLGPPYFNLEAAYAVMTSECLEKGIRDCVRTFAIP